MDFRNTRLSLRRPLTSYAKAQGLIAAAFRNRTFHIRRQAVVQKSYLDLGCGSNTHAEFINLDYDWHPGIDICWDVTRGLPLPSETLSGIFSEHCLEHLPFEAVDRLLAECNRVLKPDGTIRIIVPDGELYLTGYSRIRKGDSEVKLPYSDTDGYHGLYSPIISVNRIFRGHGHLFIYDFDMFRQLLTKNGFTKIAKAAFRSGRDERLLIDTESRAVESLYVEASKPNI